MAKAKAKQTKTKPENNKRKIKQFENNTVHKHLYVSVLHHNLQVENEQNEQLQLKLE